MTRTVNQSNRFHALLTIRRFDREDKQELVKLYTNGRETSSTKMSVDEMAEAIKHLEGMEETSMKKMRSKIINIARDIFELRQNDNWEQAHYDRLNTHLVRTCKKRLHELSYGELIVAVTSLENWRKTNTTKMVNEIMGIEPRKVGRPKKNPLNTV